MTDIRSILSRKQSLSHLEVPTLHQPKPYEKYQFAIVATAVTMEADYDLSPFKKGELTDSSSEQSSNAATPNRASFINNFDYPSHADASIGSDGNPESPARRSSWDYAWAGHSGFDDGTNTGITHLPHYSQLASEIGQIEAEDGLDQVPHFVTLFDGIQTHRHHSSSPTTWDPNCQLVTGLLSSRSARAPSNPDRSTAHGQPSFVPFEGAAPLTSIAPQPALVPSETKDSDDDFDIAMDDSDIEADQIPAPSSKSVHTLRESYCPFGESITWDRLYDSDGATVQAKIFARFRSKSLDKTCANEPHYITYRRNYFSNEIWFGLEPPTESAHGKLYVDYEGARYPVQSFGVRMRAVDNDQHGEDVEISVFTPKRDRPIVPTPTLEQKMQPNMPKYSHVYDESTGFGSNKLSLPSIHSYVHNQFRQATKNNGSRRKQQSYYRIVVELRTFIFGPSGDQVWVKVASTVSGLLVVRGRCPGSFADDPNHQNSKPRKVSQRRRDYKAARPTKKKGQSKPNSYKAPRKVGSRRTSGHTVSSTIPPSVSLTSDSRSCASTNITPFSPSPQMSPKDEIRESLRLPNPDGTLLLLETPETAASSRTKEQDGAFQDEVFTFEYKAHNVTAGGITDEHERNLATQLNKHGFGLGQRYYLDLQLQMSAHSTLQDIDVSSTPWENTNDHVDDAR